MSELQAGVAGDPDGAIYFDQFLEVWKSTVQVTQVSPSLGRASGTRPSPPVCPPLCSGS